MGPNEVQKLVAEGKIPISFDMNELEVTALHRPPTFFVMAPRLSYLPLVSRSARESFQETAPDIGESGMWFEYEGHPLKWNIPIGVLYDYFTNKHNQPSQGQSSSTDLPFAVTIRFQGFPKNKLLPCSGEIDVERAFFHSMKHALSLRFGSAKKLMDLSKVNQEALWDGIVFAKTDKVWEVLSTITRSQEGDTSGVSPKLPIRVLLKRADETANLQLLHGSVSLESQTSLRQAVLTILSEHPSVDLAPSDQIKIVVQGVTPPPDAPAVEVSNEMSAFDLFLYVVVLVS